MWPPLAPLLKRGIETPGKPQSVFRVSRQEEKAPPYLRPGIIIKIKVILFYVIGKYSIVLQA